MNHLIYPCLWYDANAKEAAELYCSAFENSKIVFESQMVVNFELNGQKIMGLNGGPMFKPNPSISFFAVFESFEELDHTWNTFIKEGSVLMPLDRYGWSEKYGWLLDKFGISWQLFIGKLEDFGQKITPAFMFANQQTGKAKQAIEHYTGIFDHSSIVALFKYEVGENDVEGYIKHGQFKLNNQLFIAMDSSIPHAFDFNEGISLVVECDTQDEIDYFWDRLTEGGSESQCGWLKDKFGVSWQIIPAILSELMSNPEKTERVVQAFLQMKKFDIEKLRQA